MELFTGAKLDNEDENWKGFINDVDQSGDNEVNTL